MRTFPHSWMAHRPWVIRLFGHLLVRRQRRRKPPRHRANRVAKAPEKCEERLPVTDVFFTTTAVSAALEAASPTMEVAQEDLSYADLSADEDESPNETPSSSVSLATQSINTAEIHSVPTAYQIEILDSGAQSHAGAAPANALSTDLMGELWSDPLADDENSQTSLALLNSAIGSEADAPSGPSGGSLAAVSPEGVTLDASAPAASATADATSTSDPALAAGALGSTDSSGTSEPVLKTEESTSTTGDGTSDSSFSTMTTTDSSSETDPLARETSDIPTMMPQPDEFFTNPPISPPGLAAGWTDPLWVLSANEAAVLVPGVIQHSYSTWSMDLRAQVSGGIVDDYAWDLSQAPDVQNVTGTGTYRLQFDWASFQGSPRTNTITITTTNTDSTVQSQVLTFLVQPTNFMGQVPPAPTSANTWGAVLSPDQIKAEQELIQAADYAISPVTGALYVAHELPSYNPGVAPIRLVYSSLAADPRPIFIDHFQLDPARAAAPSRVSAKLTLNGVAGSDIWYDTSLLNPGGILQIALQGQAGLATGRYAYSIDVTEHYATATTTTHSGHVNVINSSTSNLGAGWSLAGLSRIHPVTGGVILEMAGGLSLWFADGAQAGTYVTPAGDFSTLVKNGDNTWTRTMKDGVQVNFRSDGRQTSVVDRNLNTLTYNWDATFPDRLVSIVDQNNVATNLGYTSGMVSTFIDVANRVTQLTHTSGRLTSLTMPDTAVWGHGYDSSSRMTSLTTPRSHTTTFGLDFAGRVGIVTRPDTTTEQLTPLVIRGLAQAPYGTQGNPAIAVLAVEATASYTDPRANVWQSRHDWLGFGLATASADPMAHNAVVHVTPNGLPWLVNDPLNRRTYTEFDASANPTKVVLPDYNSESFVWNSFSQPTQYTNPRGKNTTYVYSATGSNLITIRNALNGEKTFTHTTDGLVATATNEVGETTAFSYDARDRLVEIEFPDDSPDPNPFVTMAYNAASDMTSYTNERGFTTTTTFDQMGRPLQITLPDLNGDPNDNPKYTTVYDLYGNTTSRSDPLNHTETASYDSMNRVLTEADPLNNVTEYVWGAASQLEAVEDPMGRVTSLAWDSALRNTSITLPDPDLGGPLLAPVITMAYDAASQRTAFTDGLNRTWTTQYHPRGWVLLVVDPMGNEQGAGYDANGNVIQRTESGPGGMSAGQQGYLFDDLDRNVSYTDQLSHTTTHSFDAASRRTSTTNALGFQTSFTYGARDELRTVTTPDPDGPSNPLLPSVITFGYDLALNRTSVVDALNRTTTTTFDAQDRATETLDPMGGVTRVTFDLAGRMTELTDPVNNTTSWSHDNADRVVSETNVLNFARTFVYNGADELTSVTDRNGRERTFARDNLGRITSEQWLDAAQNPIHTINYVHDVASQLTSVSDAYSSYAFGYNDAGWVTSEDNSGTPGMPNVILTHGYNAFGERTSRSDNVGSGGSTAFTFDQAHRLTGATLTVGSNTAQVAWTYDNADRMTRITRNGMGSEVWTDITLDNMDRVKRIAHSSYAKGMMFGNPALSAFDYTWNAASEITSYTGPEGTLNYSYDTTSQLTGVSGARAEAYSYDLNGNRTMAGYSTGTGNRLLSDGVYNYQHDNEGNLTVQTRISDSQRTEFTWDHRNRLTKVLVKDSGGAVLREARFTYDVFDRLIGRWVDMDGAGPQAAVQTWHAYDGANPYADFNSSGALTNRYLYKAIDELMGRMSSSGVVDWYMPDLIGSTRQIVNKMGTSTLHTANYDSFGNIASQSGTGDRFKYAARELEAAIDQYHNRARWYDPRVGRFTGEDPIGFEGGDANLFRYVHNSPLQFRDPLGHSAWSNYFRDVGQTAKGYFWNGPISLGAGAWNAVTHPIQTAKGIGHAVAHPIQTGQAVYQQAKQQAQTPQGQGQLGFTIASGILSGPANAAKAAQVAKMAKAATVAKTAQATQKAAQVAKSAATKTKTAVQNANKPPAVSSGLVTQAVYQTKYKTFAAAMKVNWHHIWPKYLGPPPAAFTHLSATLVGIPAAYHTVIHQAIQAALPRALAGTFTPQQIYQQLTAIYQKYPLSGFPTKTFPQPVQ
ncbi:MAG: RHS repeat-associated core domain-containing protein [Pirellulales bacterium]